MSTASAIAGRIYPAKSAKLELIDLLKEQIHAPYQRGDRASITRPILDRVVADLEHAVQLLDALQDERAARFAPIDEASYADLRASGGDPEGIASQQIP